MRTKCGAFALAPDPALLVVAVGLLLRKRTNCEKGWMGLCFWLGAIGASSGAHEFHSLRSVQISCWKNEQNDHLLLLTPLSVMYARHVRQELRWGILIVLIATLG